MHKMKLEQYQQTLTKILLAPELADVETLSQQMQLPQGVNAIEGSLQLAEVRLNIYRNNVIYSLSEALAAQFPVVKKLVGDSFFAALAKDFVTAFPPQQAALFSYGESFPEFIGEHEHCRPLPYLSDVALLEWCYQVSVNAADDPLLYPDQLMNIDQESLGELVFRLQSSAILFSSPYPVIHIREANLPDQLNDDAKAIDLDTTAASRALILRRDFEVSIINLDAAAFHLLNEFNQGKTINQAWQSTQEKLSLDEAQLSTSFSFLLSLGVFKRLTTNQSSSTSQSSSGI